MEIDSYTNEINFISLATRQQSIMTYHDLALVHVVDSNADPQPRSKNDVISELTKENQRKGVS